MSDAHGTSVELLKNKVKKIATFVTFTCAIYLHCLPHFYSTQSRVLHLHRRLVKL